MQERFLLQYALKGGEIISVEDVESGLDCGCVCPACGGQLMAKKGTEKIHHFAHRPEINCEYGYETLLHLVAKDILSKAKKITIPPVYVTFPDPVTRNELFCAAKEICIDRVELEERDGSVIPDVVVYVRGKKFFIEIYVTHPIDDEKLEKIRKKGVSTIEIDLSKKSRTTSIEELTEILINDSPVKKWKYNTQSDLLLKQFLSVTEKQPIRCWEGWYYYIEECPVRKKEYEEEIFYFYDCCECVYFIACDTDEKTVFCSGRNKVSTIAELRAYITALKEAHDVT